MTARELRNRRRAEERKTHKSQSKTDAIHLDLGVSPETIAEFGPEFIAQANAIRDRVHRKLSEEAPFTPGQSTGPRSSTGKATSSRNSFKHGLASGAIVVPGEDPAAFDALLDDLLADHAAANCTEELLVHEMAQSYWLMQRATRLQNACWAGSDADCKQLALFLRYRTTYERAFHKAFNTLLQLKKQRMQANRQFVSQKAPESGHPAKDEAAFLSGPRTASLEPSEPKTQREFVRQNYRPSELKLPDSPHQMYSFALSRR